MPKVSRRWKPEMSDYMNERVYELKLEGKHPIDETKELSFKGERGRFKFKWARRCSDGSWEITVYGGTKRYQAYRTFKGDRIKAVHYKQKLRSSK